MGWHSFYKSPRSTKLLPYLVEVKKIGTNEKHLIGIDARSAKEAKQKLRNKVSSGYVIVKAELAI